MKKLLVLMIILFVSQCSFASDLKDLPYKGIKQDGKIKITEADTWTDKVRHKDLNYFIKQGSVLYNKSNSKSYTTDCDYMFIYGGRLIGYSETDLKFYEFVPSAEHISKNELNLSEVAQLFRDFRIILISDFSTTTNVYKFRKKRSKENILILNNTDIKFYNYGFTTNNSEFEKYIINNTICITKKGLIQFSQFGENTKNTPWFIILVR
jgi:hypothetical protein